VQRAEIRERIASNSLHKIRTRFYEFAGHVGRVKTIVTNSGVQRSGDARGDCLIGCPPSDI